MKTFLQIAEQLQQREVSGKSYLEFLRVPSMSAGVYVLPAGGVDLQSPHKEDEVYYVIRGHARMRVGSAGHSSGSGNEKVSEHDGVADQEIEQGSIIFVAANVEHKFYDITEELVVLVFFAPAES